MTRTPKSWWVLSGCKRQITTRKETLDYYIPWCSLHRAHIIAPKECAATLFSWTLVAIARSINKEVMSSMTYEQLIRDSKEYSKLEPRSISYDYYLASKDWQVWLNSSRLPHREVLLLFGFILSWDRNFKGDIDTFIRQYEKAFPSIRHLSGHVLWKTDLTDEIMKEIAHTFDLVAKCTTVGHFEGTDASKILHTILPDLFVMWDDKIRRGILGRRAGKDSMTYAFQFVPRMKEEIRLILESYTTRRHCSADIASLRISEACSGHNLCKLIDESNYVNHTLNNARHVA